jgi:hypothetical protein
VGLWLTSRGWQLARFFLASERRTKKRGGAVRCGDGRATEINGVLGSSSSMRLARGSYGRHPHRGVHEMGIASAAPCACCVREGQEGLRLLALSQRGSGPGWLLGHSVSEGKEAAAASVGPWLCSCWACGRGHELSQQRWKGRRPVGLDKACWPGNKEGSFSKFHLRVQGEGYLQAQQRKEPNHTCASHTTWCIDLLQK